ncbi:hypothetical protein IGI04_038752 [Brassica rapa subsp. trilocularis]|uniref:Longin domain-containing protein n=2 Tax=Brassica TaxID=3705 RepID=A0ABQ7LLZ2_BRACM|nr:hypothetical protein IGI04_038752 [Brassica rapa subsp. trilocularis]
MADVSYGWRKLRHEMVKSRTRSREKTAYLIKTSSFLDFEFVSMAFAIDYVIVFQKRSSTEKKTKEFDLSFKPSKLLTSQLSNAPCHQDMSARRVRSPITGRDKAEMVKMTLIARVTDGLPLAEGLDDGRDLPDSDMYKQQVKSLFKNLSRGHNEASRMSVETGPYVFHYIIEGRVCYLTMCDRSYPKKLAFQYLEDLRNEFERVNGPNIETAARPYAFIKFDTFIQKTKKLYQDTRTQRNIAKLNDELYEVHQIMTRNVQEVLGVGEKLDQVSEMSSRLTSESRIYADKAKDLNRQALIRKWAPVAIVLGVVFLLFWVKNKLWLLVKALQEGLELSFFVFADGKESSRDHIPSSTMQHLLFAVVLAEVAVILALSFKTPIRKLLIMSLDRAKRGRGPVVVQTVSATVCVVLVASVYSMMKIQKRWVEEGAMNPTDEVIVSKHLLESTLMGGFLFLGLMIDRLHHYMRELRMRRKTMEAIKKEGSVLEGEKARASDEVKSLKQEITALQERQKQLAAEIEAKSKEIRTEETSGIALQKQSEGFLIEFNRLSEENQDLRNQLHTVDSRISRSSIKKNT